MQMAKDKQELPEPIQKMLQTDVKEDIKDQQKHLNKHRNVVQKIEAKKRAIQKDQDQWQAWLKEVKQKISQQKQKHEEHVSKLMQDLKLLEQQEEDIRLHRFPEEKDLAVKDEDAEMTAEALVESLLSEDEMKAEKEDPTNTRGQHRLLPR